MPSTAQKIIDSLKAAANSEKAAFFPRFFKTGPGQYGEGDQFWGVTVPDMRAVAKAHRLASFSDIENLLSSPIHEQRFTGLLILTYQYPKADVAGQEAIIKFYLDHLDAANNWDLVDCSASELLGRHLLDKSRSVLYELAKSGHLWRERVAIVATLHFIKHNDFTDSLKLAEQYLAHPHDLIHKATGWVLREVGKRDLDTLRRFLNKNRAFMPRTMLRYAIERFPEPERLRYLKG